MVIRSQVCFAICALFIFTHFNEYRTCIDWAQQEQHTYTGNRRCARIALILYMVVYIGASHYSILCFLQLCAYYYNILCHRLCICAFSLSPCNIIELLFCFRLFFGAHITSVFVFSPSMFIILLINSMGELLVQVNLQEVQQTT